MCWTHRILEFGGKVGYHECSAAELGIRLGVGSGSGNRGRDEDLQSTYLVP